MKDLTPLHLQRGTGTLPVEPTTVTTPAGTSEAVQPVDGTNVPSATAEPQDAHEGRGPMQTATYETQSVTFRDVPPQAPPGGPGSTTGSSVGTGMVGSGMLLNTRLRYDGTGSGVSLRSNPTNFSLAPSGRSDNASPGTGTTYALPDYLRPQAMGTWRPGLGNSHPPSASQSNYTTFPTLYSPFAMGGNANPYRPMGEFKFGDSLGASSHGLAWSHILFASNATSPATSDGAAGQPAKPDLHATASQMLAQTYFVRSSPKAAQAHEDLAAVLAAHNANPTAETEAALCREMMEFTTAIRNLKIGDLPAKPAAGSQQANLLNGIRNNFEQRFGTKGWITDADNNPQVKALLDALGCDTIADMQRKLGLKDDGLFGERTFFQAQLATLTMATKELMGVAELALRSEQVKMMGIGLERLGSNGAGLLRMTQDGKLHQPVIDRITARGYEVDGNRILKQGHELNADEVRALGAELYASGVERFMTLSAEVTGLRDQVGEAGGILPIYMERLDNNIGTFAHLEKVLKGEVTGPVTGKLATMTAVVLGGTDQISNRLELANQLRQGVKLSDLTEEMKALIQDIKAAQGAQGTNIVERDGMVFLLDLTDADMADMTAEANDILNPPAGLEAIYGKLRQMSDQAAELRAIQLTFELSQLDIAQAAKMGLQAFDAVAELKDVTRKMKEVQHVFEAIADELRAVREAQEGAPVERETFIEASPATHQLPPLDPPGRRRSKGSGKADEQFDLSALIKRQAEYLRSWDDQLQQEYMQAIEARSVRRSVERREARHVVSSAEVLDAAGKAVQVTTTADGRMRVGQ